MQTILTLLLAATPLSLILLKLYDKLMARSSAIANTELLVMPVVGTFTDEEVSLKTILYGENRLNIEQNGNITLVSKEEQEVPFKEDLKSLRPLQLAATISAFCHYQKLQKIETTTIDFLTAHELNPKNFKEHYQIIQEMPFESEKKVSTVITIDPKTKDIFSFSKGNPEEIFRRCNRIMIDGKNQEFDQKLRKKLRRKLKNAAKQGEKMIAFAYKPLPKKRYQKYSEEYAENELSLLCLIGLGHNQKQDNLAILKKINELALETLIVDPGKENKIVSTAQELKLIKPQHCEAFNHQDIRDISDQKLKKLLSEKTALFCESGDEDLKKIERNLQEMKVKFLTIKPGDQLEKLLDQIKLARLSNLNNEKVYAHSIQARLNAFVPTILAFIAKAPLPFSPVILLILEIGVNLPIQIALKYESDDTNRANLLIHGFISSIFISLAYFFTLIRLGWHSGLELSGPAAFSAISASIAIAFYIIVQTLNAYKIRKYLHFSNNSALLTISLIIIISTMILVKNSYLDWLLITYLTVTIYLLDWLKDYAIHRK